MIFELPPFFMECGYLAESERAQQQNPGYRREFAHGLADYIRASFDQRGSAEPARI
jgi:hypothetical protein